MVVPVPRAARFVAVCVAMVGGVAAGCSDDGGNETYETPNEVDGTPTDGQPEGTVDSRDEGTPDGE